VRKVRPFDRIPEIPDLLRRQVERTKVLNRPSEAPLRLGRDALLKVRNNPDAVADVRACRMKNRGDQDGVKINPTATSSTRSTPGEPNP
jgi:hypothetical protein